MKKTCNFGDIHFSYIRPWSKQAGENFIEWFDKNDFGPKDDLEFFFAGDISEKESNPGEVVSQIYRFFEIASKKAKMVYICMGNHDTKLYHEKETNSLIFLQDAFPNIKVIEKEEAFTTSNGFKALVLPHQRFDDITIEDYYNSYIPKLKNKSYDIIVGHWKVGEADKKGFFGGGVDISSLKAKCWVLGHIHSRIRKEYIGSVMPNNSDEMNTTFKRCYKEYNENGQCIEMPLPDFLRYEEIEYDKKLPEKVPNCTYVYTVIGAPNERLASEKFPGEFVKGIQKKQKADFSQVTTEKQSLDFKAKPKEMLDALVKETGFKISRSAYSICEDLLS